MIESGAAQPARQWQPTAALLRVAVLPAALALIAVLARRADLLYVAAPLAVAALAAVLARPAAGADVAFDVPVDMAMEGATVVARVTARPTGSSAGIDMVTAAVSAPGWVRMAAGRTAVMARLPTVGAPTVLDVPLRALRWGRQPVGPVVVTLVAANGLLRLGPIVLPQRRVPVLPLSPRFDGAAEVPQARGGLGVHRSLRAGAGSELTGIRPFVTGDRMRRINWRASQRSGELQVNATLAERDADVVLFLDARYDAGVSGGIDGRASGVDVAVRATAALARFYLRLGDRVGVTVQGESVRYVPVSAGRPGLLRILDALLDVSPPRLRVGEAALNIPIGVDPRALVVLLTPLVGQAVFTCAATLARTGHPLVVVDTLPGDAEPGEQTEWTALALRLWRLERDTRIHRLTELGVPVVDWRGPGSLDTVLLDLARMTAAPRVRR